MLRIKYIILSLLLFSCDINRTLEPTYSDFEIDYLKIGIDHSDILKLKSNKIKNFYVTMFMQTDSAKYRGRIRALGAGSRYLTKWGYKVELNNAEYKGLTEFNLSSNSFDKSGIMPLIARDYFDDLGFDMYDVLPVAVSVNDEFVSLYPLIERFELRYFQRRNKPVAEIFKVGFNAKFTNIDNPYLENYFDKEYPNDDNYHSLYDLFEILDHTSPADLYDRLQNYMDIGNYLKFHVAMTILANPDAQRNNILMYKEDSGLPFKFMPWDFDNLLSNRTDFFFYADNEIIAALLKNRRIRELYAQEFLRQLEINIPRVPSYFDKYKEQVREVYNIDPYRGQIYNLDEEIEYYKHFITSRRTGLLERYDEFFDKDYYDNGL